MMPNAQLKNLGRYKLEREGAEEGEDKIAHMFSTKIPKCQRGIVWMGQRISRKVHLWRHSPVLGCIAGRSDCRARLKLGNLLLSLCTEKDSVETLRCEIQMWNLFFLPGRSRNSVFFIFPLNCSDQSWTSWFPLNIEVFLPPPGWNRTFCLFLFSLSVLLICLSVWFLYFFSFCIRLSFLFACFLLFFRLFCLFWLFCGAWLGVLKNITVTITGRWA